MPKKSIWTQTAEANALDKGLLGAVIYYSGRSWSVATVYGPKSVVNAVSEPKPWNPNPSVQHKQKNELPAVPIQGYLVDGSKYGLKEGQKVLLVPGRAPE